MLTNTEREPIIAALEVVENALTNELRDHRELLAMETYPPRPVFLNSWLAMIDDINERINQINREYSAVKSMKTRFASPMPTHHPMNNTSNMCV